ncbi:MAG: substrate-binding domain-containing protein [Gammaproteobacteria bacterium]|nr:substrate-binding domain-containing protein [Gammaproteobacteria bacterium]MDH3509050.1 substrate-binding domain-containing protein [Gammaproteobacteria bacterium]
MRAYARSIAACILAASGVLSLGVACAADLVILASQGAAPGVRALAAEFEHASGHRVTVVQPDDATLERRSGDGTADLVTGNAGVLAELVSDGKVVASTVAPFVLAGLGVSVRAGAPQPDISTVESYVRALRAAESIGYSGGCSGTHVAEGIAELGLTEELASKTTRTTGGPVTAYLARGDFELGIQQTNIMVNVPGSDYVGPVPGELNKPCQTNVGLLVASSEPEAAREMIRYMLSPQAAPVLRETHVEPFAP